MKRFALFIPWGMMLLLCGIFIGASNADVFAPVPAGSPLYAQLQMVQNASWENDISGKTPRPSKSSELTRYEFAIEIAKSTIDFNAHEQANPNWINTVPRAQLRALRALALEFSSELSGFKVNSQKLTRSIDTVLRSPAAVTNDNNTPLSLNNQITTPANNASAEGSFPLTSELDLANTPAPDALNLSLSQQFQLYAQLSAQPNALLHAASPIEQITSPNSDISAKENTALSAGAQMSINDWLSLRAGYAFNQNNQPMTLQQTLLSAKNNPWYSSLGAANTFGGGLDVKVSPGLTFSGGISRLSLNAPGQQNVFSGTQLEGGVGVSGLNNRLLLSAQLARLMPDNATSLASTAARLNLDLAVSNNLSFNLLYQQMFSLSPQQDAGSTFAGGVNIHF